MQILYVPKDRKTLFRQFLAGMYDAVVITDPDGHILDLNPRAEEYFGYRLEDVVDQPVTKLFPRLSPEVVKRIHAGQAEKNRFLIDVRGRRRDGMLFACEVSVTTLAMQGPDDLVFTVRNVERSRRLRAALRAKEAAFDLADAALFVCAPDGRLRETNAAFHEMFGLADEAAARAWCFAGLFPGEAMAEGFRRALAGERVSAADDGVVVRLAPVRDGRAVDGVAGSVTREGGHA